MENFYYRLELCKCIFQEFIIFENKYQTILKEFSDNIKNNMLVYIKKGGLDYSKGILSTYLMYVNYTINKLKENVEEFLSTIKGNVDNINKIISNQHLSLLKEIDDEKENIKKLLLKVDNYKSSYYEKMNNAEKSIFLYEQSLLNEKQNNNNSLLINQNDLINKAKKAEKDYKDYLTRINDQRINYYKKLSDLILNYRKFNFNEVQTLENLFTTLIKINENELDILNTGKTHFHKHLFNSMIDLSVPFPNDNEINFSYEIEPYISSYYKFISQDNTININDKNQIYHQVINKLKNEFKYVKEDICDINSLKEHIKFSNILYHIKYYCTNIKNEEIELMKNYFKTRKYREQFILFLNNLRNNLTIFNDPKAFFQICTLFNLLFDNIDFSNPKEHNNICFAILLCQTFYTNFYGDKRFIVHNLNLNFNEPMFIDFIEKEIENNNSKGNEFITVVSFSAHLKDILKEKSRIMIVFNYFIEKYKFTEKEIKDIKEQLNDLKEIEKKEEEKKEEEKEEKKE